MTETKALDHPAHIESGARPSPIIPKNIPEAWQIAQVVMKSGLAPPDFGNAHRILVAILHGMEIGIPPMQALQGMAVINGRPGVYGDLALALVRASGLLTGFKETFEGEGDELKAVCTLRRDGDADDVRTEFSVADAKTAKLWEKRGKSGQDTPWITHPKRMLKMRARGFALRDAFPDVLKGLRLVEELQDEPAMRDITPTAPGDQMPDMDLPESAMPPDPDASTIDGETTPPDPRVLHPEPDAQHEPEPEPEPEPEIKFTDPSENPDAYLDELEQMLSDAAKNNDRATFAEIWNAHVDLAEKLMPPDVEKALETYRTHSAKLKANDATD